MQTAPKAIFIPGSAKDAAERIAEVSSDRMAWPGEGIKNSTLNRLSNKMQVMKVRVW